MAATVSVPGLLAIRQLAVVADVDKAPFLDGYLVIVARKHAAAANIGQRKRKIELALEPANQLVHEPARDKMAPRRVYPAKIEDVSEQHLPVQVHVCEEAVPVDLTVLLENDVHDIRPVVAVAELNECLRPDELGRRDD